MNVFLSFRSVVVFTVALAVFAGGPALAQSSKEQARSKYKTRKAAAMSQPVFKSLQAAQKQIEAQDYAGALARLEKLRGTRRRLSPYEAAQSWNLTAYVFYLQERYAPAIKAYRQLLGQGDLPEALIQSTLKTMSQLYVATEQYGQALKIIRELMAKVEIPSADLYMLLGQTYFQLKQYDKALSPIKKAVSMYRQQGKAPKENWLLLLRVIYHEKDDYKAMRPVLEELIELYPKDRYLRVLAGVYSELGDTYKQLTMMESLYERGYKQTSGQILNLANLYLLHGVPYRAAKVLDEGLNKSELVKPTERSYRMLSQAWFQAREDEKSIPPMRRAAKLAKTGELHIRVAQAYQNLDRWQEAAAAIRRGLKKGGLKRTDTAQLMLGMALFNQQKLERAREHFELAQADERSEKVAGQWIAYVRSELRRKELLEFSTLPADSVKPVSDSQGS